MKKGLNLRIDISPLARKALDFESAFNSSGISECASDAILRGVSQESRDMAHKVFGTCTETESDVVKEYAVRDASAIEELCRLTQRHGCPTGEPGTVGPAGLPDDTEKVSTLAARRDDCGSTFRQNYSDKKIPINQDSDAQKYILEHMDSMTGSEIAKVLGRSKPSVNKWIAAHRKQ